MSERQARIKRKNEGVEERVVKKKSKAEIITNIIICVAVVAVLVLGVWAVASKYQSDAQQAQTDVNTENVSDDSAQQSIPTIEEYAQSVGMTGEEFIKEYGLDSNEEVTPSMELSMATEYMTLGNYAKMVGAEVSEIRESMGIDETFTDDSLMSEILAAQAVETTDDEAEATEASNDAE